MTSGAIDYGYEKDLCFNLAKSEPENSRMNANNYIFFAMESGMSKIDYEKYSGG